MTEAAESGERAARAALDDAMSLNVLRVLDTLYSAGLIASPGTPGPMAADGQGATSGVVAAGCCRAHAWSEPAGS